MTKSGFSLLEILVVLSLFVLVALLANQIFFSALRGASKSEATTLVKQNGNYALSVIQRNLYNSRGIITCAAGATGTSITYFDADGRQASFSCVNAGGTGDSYIASGSARLTSEDVSVTSSCSITCDPSPPGTPREVIVSFELKKRTGERVEEKAAFPFQTRVVLRN
ncbi:MAG: prepilin-type N-terminal cleavage/methylation domain-containing protein [Candidatus Blackburnbacteria bacterium]|nr:prepilin-type N-terminal cleavage/methylation domain-containing protein [Candidatus Blackburnbacteria bacterium]